MQAVAHPATILVVEDSPELVALLRRVLREQGFKVRSARDGESGLTSALDNQPDLLILDVGLPRRDGFEVIQELRRKGMSAPTLMLTARAHVSDRVTGLEAGADDYLIKPFDADELVARVRALLRRSGTKGRVALLRVGDLVLDPVTRDVHRGERPIVLTHREFALLDYLMRRARTTLTRAEIASQVWRQAAADVEGTNIVDVYVAYLRKKLDTEHDEPMLHTVRGIGYVFATSRGRHVIPKQGSPGIAGASLHVVVVLLRHHCSNIGPPSSTQSGLSGEGSHGNPVVTL